MAGIVRAGEEEEMPMLKRLLRVAPVALTTIALVGALAVQPAVAATTKGTRVFGSGSDTTYFLMQKLDDLYNASPGCVVIGAPQVENFTCYADTTETVKTENYYHDVSVENYPLGSSVGVSQLCHQGQAGTAVINYARSSRALRNTDCAGIRAVAYARDAITWWTHDSNTHTPASISQAQMQGIWNSCTITTWGQVNGNGGDTTPILVYTAQNGSGTRAAFDGFLGTGANSTNCIPATKKDGDFSNGERVIFENNAQPILDQNEQGTAIYPYSFGRFQQSGGEGGSLGKIDGVAATTTTIANGTFPYGRFLYNVYRATTGSLVASRATKSYIGEKTGWLCKSTAHAVNPLTGNNFRTDIANAISAEGFVPLPLGTIGGGVSGSSYCRASSPPP
jgi:ABC-type phosphate transport system substrate-binding protein